MTGSGARRREDGATAVIVAILAVVLLSAGALAVDLGNAWARKRDAQTQADLAALSAGHLLPMTAANRSSIALEVARYLGGNNEVHGQPSTVGADLTDGDPGNGEIVFENAGQRMRVRTPSARVDWVLAGVFGDGDGTSVAAEATVEVMSPLPPMSDMLPMWMPDSCPFGPGMADTASGGGKEKKDSEESDDVGCSESGGGQFGQLDSPRRDVSQLQAALAENTAVGLDHLIMPFTGATQEECGKKNHAPPTGGIQDNDPAKPVVNCLMPQTGNDGPALLDGLITGTGSSPGRLAAVNGATSSSCGGRTNTAVSGVTINNDVLSCFLRDGYSLDDIAQPTGVTQEMLDPAVVDSPRFVWIPILNTPDRDIDNNTFYAIKRFVPGFITYQHRGATRSVPGDDPTGDNGVAVSGGKVESVQVFTFNPDALPVSDRAFTMPFDPLSGSIVRLVD